MVDTLQDQVIVDVVAKPVSEDLRANLLMDLKSLREIPTYTLVREAPSWLIPVRQDKRNRQGSEYEDFFRRMMDDVRDRGVLQPIIAIRMGEFGETIDGETRRLASLAVGIKTVPILLFDQALSESDLIVAQLQSNEVRLDFSDLERAEIYAKLMALNGWSQCQLARFIHASPAQISRVMSVSNKLPDDLKALIGDGGGKIPPSSAYHLSRLPNVDLMREMASKIRNGALVRDHVEFEVAQHLGKRKVKKIKPVKLKVAGVTMIIDGPELQNVFAALAQIDGALKKLEKHGLPLSSLPTLIKT
jgi:ParB/RepB/Spo0J family partition protein